VQLAPGKGKFLSLTPAPKT